MLEHRPPAADMVDRDHRLRDECRVPERVRPDEQAEAGPFGRLRECGECGVALEDRLMRITEDRVDVIPRLNVIEPELVCTARSAKEFGPGARLAPERHTEANAGSLFGHLTAPLRRPDT